MGSQKADTDDVLIALGTHGKYQLLQYGYILFSMIPVTYPVLTYVFIGRIPDFKCNNMTQYWSQHDVYLNHTDLYEQYDNCDVTIYNQTGNSTKSEFFTSKCKDGRLFDVDKDETIISEWDLVCNREGLGELSTTLIILGQLFGAITFTSLSDIYGRLIVSYIAHIVFFIANVCLAFVPVFELFAAIRMIIGATQSGVMLAQFTTAVEIFPTHRRGAVMFVYAIGWSLACCTLPLIAYLLRNTSWRYLQLTAGLLSFHSVFSRWIQNESLRWLVANRKDDLVKRWIRSASRINNKDPEKIIKLMFPGDDTAQVNTHLVPSDTHNDNDGPDVTAHPKVDAREVWMKFITRNELLCIFRKRLLRRYTLIMCTAFLVNSLTYYGLFLTSAVMPGSRYVNFFLSSIAEIPGNILFYAIVDRIGRRKSCMVLHAIAGLSLITSVLCFTIKENEAASIASTVFNFLGKMGITGSYNLLYLYTPELYPTNMRNFGLGAACVAGTIGGMISPYSSILASRIIWGPGAIFGIGCIVVTFLTLLLPETKGRELPQTYEDINSWERAAQDNHNDNGHEKEETCELKTDIQNT